MSRKIRSRPPAAEKLSQRQLRVGEMVRHAIVSILARGGLHDPELEGVSITVSEVRMTPDLRNARIFITPLGGQDTLVIAQALNRAAAFIRRQLGKQIEVRYLPKLVFESDDLFDQGEKIEQLLRSPRVARDLLASKGFEE